MSIPQIVCGGWGGECLIIISILLVRLLLFDAFVSASQKLSFKKRIKKRIMGEQDCSSASKVTKVTE